MQTIKKTFCGLAVVLLSACGGGGGGENPTAVPQAGYPGGPVSCSVDDQNAWIRAFVSDQYYWYDKQGTPNPNAATPGVYLDSLLYKPVDRYSFAQSSASFNRLFKEGERLGWGYAFQPTNTVPPSYKFSIIEPLSPLGLAGVQRGDQVISIAGMLPEQINSSGLAGASAAGQTRTFVIQSASVQRTLNLPSALFKLSPVLASKVLSVVGPGGTGTTTVGYLAYNDFITPGNAALGAAFNHFAAKRVTELVLDMRYNGGGDVAVARDLASMILGVGSNGKVFADARFNAKNSASNTRILFKDTDLPGTQLAGIKRLVVIGGEETASASELVINGLKPYMDVVLIGATTNGKPYGSQPRSACSTTYSLVGLEFFNALALGGYSDGIAPKCTVAEDVSLPFGNSSEGRLSAALEYIQTGACPAGTKAISPLAGVSSTKAAIKRVAAGYRGESSPPQAILD
jgi:carboxyl-terminal processing protease